MGRTHESVSHSAYAATHALSRTCSLPQLALQVEGSRHFSVSPSPWGLEPCTRERLSQVTESDSLLRFPKLDLTLSPCARASPRVREGRSFGRSGCLAPMGRRADGGRFAKQNTWSPNGRGKSTGRLIRFLEVAAPLATASCLHTQGERTGVRNAKSTTYPQRS